MKASNAQSLSGQIASDCRQNVTRGGRPPNPRTLRALDNIIWACGKLETLKQRISLSSVGMLTEGVEGGPSKGGLRNSKSFSAYVKARSSEQGATSNDDRIDVLISKTGNPQIDADIAALRAHNGLLVRQVRNLTKVLQDLGIFDFASVVERGELTLANNNKGAGVSPEVRQAIEALTNPDNLKRCGLELSPTGQIVCPALRSILLNARHLVVLRHLLK
jgi:hypothetical protein